MNILRAALPVIVALALTACGGSGNGGLFGGTTLCQPGTVQLARPAPGQFNSNVNSVEVVASGNNDNIHSNPGAWSAYVQGNGGTQLFGGPLNPVSDTSGPHPFTSDFYYQSQLQQTLPSGQNWTVFLTENTGCGAIAVGNFST
ncbi:MAG TPA: hypothetical protein VFE17_05465 [Candidatus Baltobacteraceae bacterium]|jgi:hypothetical protein|nr:hypothetical protein [Candidatus Baltobacteraceae bacterium]